MTQPIPLHRPDLTAASLVRRGVTTLARRLRAERADHGVSASKLVVLGRLRRTGAMTAAKLAALERIQPQSLTRLITDLEARGLVRRRPDLEDRRQVLIEITAAGADLLHKDAWAQDVWLADAMARTLTTTERELLRMAAQLMDKLADEGADPARPPAVREEKG
jgi:DNA-binding MarR family transcriptional regulator